jgi:uncharacterized protein (DUF488 family)
MTVFTIGHSTRPLDEFTALLREAGVDLVVDIRTVPRSRANPQYNRETLADQLRLVGIGYRHVAALGGLRGRRKDGASANTLWRNDGFRNYADYAATPAFRAGLAELRALERDRVPALMCAEAVWWRCHRRIVADYLLAAGDEVVHIMGAGKLEPAQLTPGAEPRPDGTLVYGEAKGTLL